MSNLLKNLQDKPEATKKVIMWVGIIFIMAAIFTFWLLTFPLPVPSVGNSEAAANLKKELPSTWQMLKTQISDLQNLWQK